MDKNRKLTLIMRSPVGYALLLSILALCTILSIRVGSTAMSFREFFGALFLKEEYKTFSIIIYSVRIPRCLGAILAGVGLSVSGAVLQSALDNPLAAPSVIGVNSGAGAAAVITLAVFPRFLIGSVNYFLPIFAFLGAFLTTLVVIFLANKCGGTRSGIVLAGVAVSALFNAIISAATLLDTDVLASYNAFSVGGVSGVEALRLITPSAIIALSLIGGILISGGLDLMVLGEVGAATLGLRVKLHRTLALIIAAASAAAAVSFAGLLGFVGLVAPHIARRLVGLKSRPLILTSAIIGAIITTLADTLGRVLLSPSEIPLGIMMALIGVPFFITLITKRREDEI